MKELVIRRTLSIQFKHNGLKVELWINFFGIKYKQPRSMHGWLEFQALNACEHHQSGDTSLWLCDSTSVSVHQSSCIRTQSSELCIGAGNQYAKRARWSRSDFSIPPGVMQARECNEGRRNLYLVALVPIWHIRCIIQLNSVEVSAIHFMCRNWPSVLKSEKCVGRVNRSKLVSTWMRLISEIVHGIGYSHSRTTILIQPTYRA